MGHQHPSHEEKIVQPQIAICIPSGRTWEAGMALALVSICAATEAALNVQWQSGSQISMQRNELVLAAKEKGATHLFWLDSDIVAPAETINELLSHGKDIVGATYCKKVPPYEMVGKLKRADGRLKPATYMPGGCMLVRMEVYEKLEWPWYFEVAHPAEKIITSEDYSFCNKAREAGFEIWCDLDLTQRLGHIGSQTVKFSLTTGHPDRIK